VWPSRQRWDGGPNCSCPIGSTGRATGAVELAGRPGAWRCASTHALGCRQQPSRSPRRNPQTCALTRSGRSVRSSLLRRSRRSWPEWSSIRDQNWPRQPQSSCGRDTGIRNRPEQPSPVHTRECARWGSDYWIPGTDLLLQAGPGQECPFPGGSWANRTLSLHRAIPPLLAAPRPQSARFLSNTVSCATVRRRARADKAPSAAAEILITVVV